MLTSLLLAILVLTTQAQARTHALTVLKANTALKSVSRRMELAVPPTSSALLDPTPSKAVNPQNMNHQEFAKRVHPETTAGQLELAPITKGIAMMASFARVVHSRASPTLPSTSIATTRTS